MLKAIDLIGNTVNLFRLESSKTKSFEIDGWNTMNAVDFGRDLIVIDRVYKYINGVVAISFYKETLECIQTVHVPDDFKLEIVTEETTEAKQLLEKYYNCVLSNLTARLYHTTIMTGIGSDPEIFVEAEDNIIPAFDFLGSKAKPNKAPNIAYGNNNLYWDGFQCEFDTTPDTCLAYQVDSVRNGLKGLLVEARKHNKKAKLSTKTTFDIPVEYLEKAKDEHVEFGCMPSMNAYGIEGIKLNGREVPFRSAGGHIHFGISNFNKQDAAKYVKALDAILGVACVSMFASFDNPRRRAMYGLAGEYRLPPHGLEYRTLSNAWMCHPLIMNIVFDTSRKVLMFGHSNLLRFWGATEEETIRVINTCDVEGARTILKRNKDLFIKILQSKYSGNASYVYDIFMNGVESVILHPEDIEHNWVLNGEWLQHCETKYKNWFTSCDAIVKRLKIS